MPAKSRSSAHKKPLEPSKRLAKTAIKTRKTNAKTARSAARNSANDKAIREHVLALLSGGGAHLSFDQALADMPEELRGVKPKGTPHTAWALLEHMRIAQWDILEFSRDAKHVSPSWPDGYWPKTDAPPDTDAWEASIKSFRTDLKEMQGLVSNPKVDLLARIPHGDGQTLLREALLVADHNAYHMGQMVLLRRLLGAWKQ